MDTDAHPFDGRLKPGSIRRVLHVIFVLVAIVVGARYAEQALPRYLPYDWSQVHEFDAFQDWEAVRLHVRGVNPYTKLGREELQTAANGHPPVAILWVYPIVHLEKPIAAELMALSTLLLLAVHLYLCAREIQFPSPIALAFLLFGWALTTEGLVNHWHMIQTSEQIAFFLVLCWVYLRRAREWQAGIALAVAATFKLFPGVLFLFLLLARRFRAFAAASLGFGLAVAITIAQFGLGSWKEYFGQQGLVAYVWMGSVRNASLQGAILRLLSPVCVTVPRPTPTATFIATTISVALLVVAAVASLGALRRARKDDPRAVDVPFALFTVIAVFVNPWVWEHYWVLLIQPAFVVASTLYLRFRDALSEWLDETASHRALLVAALPFSIGVAGILAIGKLVETQNIHTDHLLEAYKATKNAWVHHELHLYEVFNTAPWVIMIALCLMTVRFVTPGRRRARIEAGR